MELSNLLAVNFLLESHSEADYDLEWNGSERLSTNHDPIPTSVTSPPHPQLGCSLDGIAAMADIEPIEPPSPSVALEPEEILPPGTTTNNQGDINPMIGSALSLREASLLRSFTQKIAPGVSTCEYNSEDDSLTRRR